MAPPGPVGRSPVGRGPTDVYGTGAGTLLSLTGSGSGTFTGAPDIIGSVGRAPVGRAPVGRELNLDSGGVVSGNGIGTLPSITGTGTGTAFYATPSTGVVSTSSGGGGGATIIPQSVKDWVRARDTVRAYGNGNLPFITATAVGVTGWKLLVKNKVKKTQPSAPPRLTYRIDSFQPIPPSISTVVGLPVSNYPRLTDRDRKDIEELILIGVI